MTTRYRVYRNGSYVGSMSARSKSVVRRTFAADYKCKPEEIDVRSPSELSPAEEDLKARGLLKQ